MKYWLLKTEPEEWSWKQQVKSGKKGTEWNGVRNFQAAKNLRNMKVGDKCFFYHTGKSKSIVGIVKVIKKAFLDKSDKTKITIENVGHPILLDAFSNMGFAALMLSSIIPMVQMGGLMVFAMLACSFGTLTLLASAMELGKNNLK